MVIQPCPMCRQLGADVKKPLGSQVTWCRTDECILRVQLCSANEATFNSTACKVGALSGAATHGSDHAAYRQVKRKG